VLGGGGGILEEAKRDPAGRELVLDPEVLFDRRRGVPHDPIGLRCGVGIEQLAREQPALDPPLVGVMDLGNLMRRREHQLGGLGDLVGAPQQLNAAEQHAGVLMGARRQTLDQGLCVGSLFIDRGPCLDDGGLVAAKADRRA
jgi:hypothetical protein